MKATGIVRRIEEYGTIGQKPLKAAKTLGIPAVFEEKFLIKTACFDLYTQQKGLSH